MQHLHIMKSPTSLEKDVYISPKDCQKRRNSHLFRHLKNTKRTRKSKKIILGKPCNGKQKMSLQELKALSRQIKPLSAASDASNKLKPRDLPVCSSYHHQDEEKRSIAMLSRCLRENMYRAKSRMLDSLKKSDAPQDAQIYKILISKSTGCEGTTPDLGNSDNEDDCSSVSTLSSLQFRLMADEAGKVSVVLSDPSQQQDNNDSCGFMPVYTPPMMNVFQNPWSVQEKDNNYDVTEDQINSWLQRGGHDDSMSLITMATDQELADLLDFDM
ncbi:uncharacterized protein B0P05DRAFT_551552 [Gilbertella persicaria]|uniref:uncharacterized protein n=1 Tax=Gilbertella persicaria TaxID=101096 RepID=UPI00221FAE78|nr:uncharacterized protein B0P05DRAFT_551552 [Gilbertella persicaria]KAI8069098.1 hypothetical protein B0P05DRAFT_551552 [Gilbertella persicaria]